MAAGHSVAEQQILLLLCVSISYMGSDVNAYSCIEAGWLVWFLLQRMSFTK